MEEIIAFPLILAILAAYYRTTNPKKKAYVLSFSVVAGIISALISAYIRRLPNYVNRANLGFYSMIPVIISAILIIFILVFEKKIKSKSEVVFENILGSLVSINIISSFFCYMPSFFLQMDSFVYYGESAVSTIVLFRVIGFVLAIIMLLLSLFVIYRTGMKLESSKLKGILIFSMLVRGITQLNVIVSRLYSLKIIPKNSTVFVITAYITNNARIFDFALMAVLIIVPVILWLQNIKITESYRNNAEFRKIVYNMRRRRHLAQFFLFVMIINILSLSVIKTYANREVPLSAPEDYKLENGHIEITLDSVSDGHLHRYVYEARDGKKVRFIVVQKSQGSYGVGLDACEICGPSGYFERNNEVVCKLCDVVMNKGTIGFKGGCNPIPFEYKVHDQKIKIDIEVLENLSYVFK
jgi:putative membrane protein